MAWRKPANAHEWLRVIQGHEKKFFFPAMIVMVSVVIGSLFLPREYSAQAVIEQAKDSALQQMGNSMIEKNLNELRAKYRRLVSGRAAIEQLIDDLRLTRDLPHTENGELTPEGKQAKNDMIEDLKKRIQTSLRSRGPMDEIIIKFTHPHREKVPLVVNTLVENYVLKARQDLDFGIKAPKLFFERNVADWEREEQKWQKKKLDFERDHPAQLFKDPAAVETRLTELRDNLKAVTIDLTQYKEKRDALIEWVKGQPEYIETARTGQNPEILELLDKKKVVQAELESHLYGFGRTDEHPAVKRSRERLQEIEEQIKSTEDQIVVGKDIAPNLAKSDAQKEIENLNASISAQELTRVGLLDDIEETDSLKRNFFAKRNEYQQIDREMKEATSQLKFYKEKLRETETAHEAESSQRGVRLRVEEWAVEPNRPSKPTIYLILGAALALGLGTGGLLVILAELLDNSLRSIDQAVDDLKLPVLGAVNEIISPSEMLRKKVFGRGVYPVLAGVMGVILLISFYAANKSLSDPTGYEKLRNYPRLYFEQVLFGG